MTRVGHLLEHLHEVLNQQRGGEEQERSEQRALGDVFGVEVEHYPLLLRAHLDSYTICFSEK